jgi:TRAP-type C4-dicarboxylate transport system substrate-binding protein
MRLHRIVVLLLALIVTLPLEARTIKIATLLTDGTRWMRIMRDSAAQIEAETEGRVILKFYPGGVMGNESAVLRKIRAGQLHGSVINSGSLTQYYPDVWLYGLPLIFESYEEVDYVRDRMDPVLIRGLREAGWEIFGFAESGFAYPMSVEPAPSVDDARAQKVWVPDNDPVAALAMEAFGIHPIPLAISDVLTALQTGMVTGVSVPPVGAIALQWHTKLRYITDLPVVYAFGALAVDRRVFTKLSEADRVVVHRVMSEAFEEINAINRRDHYSAIEALRNHGLRLVHPSPGDVAVWKSLADEATEEMLRRQAVSADLYETMEGYLNEFRSGS